MRRWTRRSAIAGLISTTAAPVLANAPLVAPSPSARPAGFPPPPRPRARPTLRDIIAASGLSGIASVIVTDLQSGEIIERSYSSAQLPPASVAKAITALYAGEVLGPFHQFQTRLFATGPLQHGRIQGDLILAGGGDPTLDTDNLADLAQSLSDLGVTHVDGEFQVWDGALPYLNEIDASQMDHLGYNPSVSGLNLNFNRVHFEWARTAGNYLVTMDARSSLYRPDVDVARMRIVDRDLPVYTYADAGNYDDWTVARSALGNNGSRWLPVRKPSLYAGEVFHTFAASKGIHMPRPIERTAPPEGNVIAAHNSGDAQNIIADCLKFSTNLTAEVLGLSASAKLAARPEAMQQSAQRMNQWIAERTGASVDLRDHSGLSDQSRVAPYQMVKMLGAAGVPQRIGPWLKSIALLDAERNPIATDISVRAKTGTLNFVSTLAGYIQTTQQRPLAFAIFCADLDKREAAKASQDDVPTGAAEWNSRAKALQQDLLKRWGRF